MKILFYRYGSITEPDLIQSFTKLNIEVVQETTQITAKKTTGSDTVKAVAELLSKEVFLFVFSINFFPALSEICNIYNVPYVSWTVDSPVLELFSPSLKNKCNRIFMFDRAQYNFFHKRNPECIFYLPLATNVSRWNNVISSASTAEKNKFASDISFVGSLYTEKNPYSAINGVPDYARGFTDGIIQAQLQVYGYNFTEERLPDNIVNEYKKVIPDLNLYDDPELARYTLANSFMGMEIAVKERHQLLSALSEKYSVDLYTLSDTKNLPKIHNRGSANSLTEMPIIFNQSKINLNMTIKPIQTGLSLRVFDVMGCGGFLICNYQEELPELYEIGTEVEIYTSREELLDKVEFYLNNESARKQIALRGYDRTCKEHTYDIRIAQMIKIISNSL